MLFRSEYPQPDAAVVDDINDNSNNLNDARWGDLVKITGATVGASVVEKDYWYELSLSDGSSATPGILLVWKQAGVSLTDLQGLAGKTMDFTGIISRIQIAPSLAERPNVLEARGRDDIFGGAPQNVSSVGEAKSKRDGTIVNFTVPQVVTLGDLGFFYMESPDSSSGIRVESDNTYSIGDKVTVTGAALTTLPSGERVLRLTPEGSITNAGTGGTVTAWTMINRSVGGKGYVDQDGKNVEFGLDNTGLLVKVFGLVTLTDFVNNYFVIDDGSAINSMEADGSKGIRVVNTPYVLMAPSFARITGVISSEVVGGKKIRVLRARQSFEEMEILAP